MTSSAPGVGGRKGDNNNSSTIVIVTASLAAVFFVVLIVLAVVLLLRRRKRRGHGKGQCLSLRMSHLFESPVYSSDMIIFFAMYLVVKATLKSQIICTEKLYNTIQVVTSITSSQDQWTLVVWLIHLSCILCFPVFLICCDFYISPLKANVNVQRQDRSMSYIRIDDGNRKETITYSNPGIVEENYVLSWKLNQRVQLWSNIEARNY